MSHAPGFIARERRRVDEVLGVGRERRREDDEVGLGEQLGRALGPRTRSSITAPNERLVAGAVGGAVARLGSAARRDHPAAERGRERADRPPDRPEPDDARPSRRAARRLQRLPGPLALELEQLRQPPAAARIIIITYSAIGREKTPRAFVITSAALADAGVSTRSTPAVAEWTQRRRGRAGEDPVERVGRQAAAEHHLDVVERAVGEALERRP